MYGVKNLLLEEIILNDFENNERMIQICNNILNIRIYELVKKAYNKGFIYPHIEEISKSTNYKIAELVYEKYLVENIFNYEELEKKCTDLNIKRQIYNLEKSEVNLNIAKVISIAKDQFEAYNIRIAYTEKCVDIPDEFYEGKGLPIPSEDIWYVSPSQHKEYIKMLKK